MKKTLQECKEIVVKEFNPQNIFPTRKDREDLIDLANKMYYEQMYSEEEIKTAFKIGLKIGYFSSVDSHFDELDLNDMCIKWFNQFKKK